jgi:hypothetical protein
VNRDDVSPIPSDDSSVRAVAQIIQLAVAPVFLLSGIGAFLNVCATRVSRIVDRSRVVEPLFYKAKAQSIAAGFARSGRSTHRQPTLSKRVE